MTDWATVLVWVGMVAILFGVCGAIFDRQVDDEPEEEWVEPSDDDIYNGIGMEGGIGFDEPAYGEHDWRL